VQRIERFSSVIRKHSSLYAFIYVYVKFDFTWCVNVLLYLPESFFALKKICYDNAYLHEKNGAEVFKNLARYWK